MTAAGLILALLALSAAGLGVGWLVVTVVAGIVRGLGPPTPAPAISLPLDPSQAHWTAVDDHQLARFLDDSTT